MQKSENCLAFKQIKQEESFVLYQKSNKKNKVYLKQHVSLQSRLVIKL